MPHTPEKNPSIHIVKKTEEMPAPEAEFFPQGICEISVTYLSQDSPEPKTHKIHTALVGPITSEQGLRGMVTRVIASVELKNFGLSFNSNPEGQKEPASLKIVVSASRAHGEDTGKKYSFDCTINPNGKVQ